MTAMATLARAHELLPASTLVGERATAFDRVHSDTRTLRAGDLFVALRGERFDGHAFLAQARAAGAVAALAERGLAAAGLPGLEVGDSRAALARLAAAWRAQMHLPLIAVTGSNGKTTVTQMIAAILRAWQGSAALATEGNYNNDLGVALTLLRLRDTHRAAVVEIGMNHPGEVAPLAAIAAPTVALVNNAQREHLEFMADVASVARENGAALAALGAGGVAVFPAHDAHAPLWRELAGARRRIEFALDAAADVQGSAVWSDGCWRMRIATPAGVLDPVALRVAGRHNLANALAACACAIAAGCPLEAVRAGLEAFEPVKGRSQLRRIARGGAAVTLIDDSYNANPDSVRAAIDVLAALPAPRWLILGDMGEVGVQGPALHAEVGAYARQCGLDLWCAGAASAAAAAAHGAARHFGALADLLVALPEGPEVQSILVKGSRFMKMEQVVAALADGAEDASRVASGSTPSGSPLGGASRGAAYAA